MGLGGISLWQLLIVLLIVLLIFGTRRLRSLGTDLGGAVKSFRSAMDEAEKEPGGQIGQDADTADVSTEPARDRADR